MRERSRDQERNQEREREGEGERKEKRERESKEKENHLLAALHHAAVAEHGFELVLEDARAQIPHKILVGIAVVWGGRRSEEQKKQRGRQPGTSRCD